MTEPMTTPTPAPKPAPQAPVSSAPVLPPPAPKRSTALLWVTLVLLAIGLAWLIYYLLVLQYYESTDDAFANGNLIAIHSAIPGSVTGFYADDTDFVTEGQLLVTLDPTDYQVAFDKELATLSATVLEVRQLYVAVESNRVNVQNKTVMLERAQYDFDNRSKLVGALAVSNEEFVHAKEALASAQWSLKEAEYHLQMAQDAVGNTTLETHPRIEAQKNNVRQAFYNLQHCNIYAPASGNIAQRTVDVGQWISPAVSLMAVIPTDYVWVDANFKETQLKHMRIGQPATVWFDIYGSGVKYRGKVLGIASGTGSVFSLIPPQNATGNWIKIVQRLPVRISLDREQLNKFPTRLGLSAEVSVDITQQDLPMMSTASASSASKPLGTTNVFDLNFDKVNALMESVIQQDQKS